MDSHRRNPAKHLDRVLLSALSVVLLFCSFYSNTWHVVAQDRYDTFQHDTESLVLGRLVQSRQSGIFSFGGLTGWGRSDENQVSGWGAGQYQAFLNGLTFSEYFPYLSQPGGQGMLFGFLDAVVPLSPQAALRLFYALTCLLSALALTLVILWFYLEFGLTVAAFALASGVLSQWLVMFGRNLWWSIWGFYLPMIAVQYFLRRQREPTHRHSISLGVVVFLSVLAKCFVNGYEYLTTTLVMMVVPLVYYAVLDRWGMRRLGAGLLIAVVSSILAVVVSASILCVQIASVQGSLWDGVYHILYSLGKRTYADVSDFPAEYTASLEASVIDVILPYLKGLFINLNNYVHTSSPIVSRFLLRIRYAYLIAVFLAASGLVWRQAKASPSAQQRSSMALVAATWFSILAPLSWFVIFKAHSSIHTHMNFIVWQMPFTLFGFAVLGLLARGIARDLIRRVRHPSPALSPNAQP